MAWFSLILTFDDCLFVYQDSLNHLVEICSSWLLILTVAVVFLSMGPEY